MRKKSHNSKWKLFERLVAAIHYAESSGAKVTWNDKINKRQFDVTIKFKYGLYEYLTCIECKDDKSPIKVKEVEAFVTKSRRHKANKAIMVSSSVYQEGCIEVAKDESIELYTLIQINTIPREILSTKFTPALHFHEIVIHSDKSNRSIPLPRENNLLTYIMRHCLVQWNNEILSLDELIKNYSAEIMQYVNETERRFKISVDSRYKTLIPYLEKFINASSISFNCKITSAKLIDQPALDPFVSYNLSSTYEYNDVLNETKNSFPILGLDLGFDTKLQEGKLYSQSMGFYYYCRKIETDTITMDLIESYQHGDLFQVFGIKQDVKYEKRYVEVSDPKIIARLRKMLAKIEG
jgi:hypothetical protein